MLTESEITTFAETHNNLWPKAQRPDANKDIAWVWRRVCGDNTIAACILALRRHAGNSKFPAKPGDIAALLPQASQTRDTKAEQAEVTRYIDEARQRVSILVEMSTDQILLAWECVKYLLAAGELEAYGHSDPLDYYNLHPDLQCKLAYRASNLRSIGAERLLKLAANVPGLVDKIRARVHQPNTPLFE